MPSVAITAASSVVGPSRVPRRYRWFAAAVVALAGAAAAVVLAVSQTRPWTSDEVFWLLAALCLLGEALPIRLARRTNYDEVTVSTAFAFAVLLAFGPAPAMALYAAASIVVDAGVRRHPVKIAFNAAQYAVSLSAAWAVLALLQGTGGALAPVPVAAVVASGVALFAVNHVLAAIGSAILTGRPVGAYVRADLWFHVWTAGFQLAVAPVLVVAAEADVALVPLLFLPVVAIYVGGRQAVMNQHRALHDELTELPNRQLFARRLEDAIAAVDETGGELVLMMADLDDFKAVNDSLGHDTGDALLVGVAERLLRATPSDAVVARFGGDEFAVLLPGAGTTEAIGVAERMLEALEQPITVGSFSLDVRASIGLAGYPDHGANGQTLFKNADIALYHAKETRTRVEAFGDHQRSSFDRLSLAEDLRRGIERGELVLHYQPKRSLARDRTEAVEALVRWQHPLLGLLTPEGFIPLAEQSNLIKPLTDWVIGEALRQCREWRDRGAEVRVAVNLSTRSLLDRRLPEEVEARLEALALPPSALEFEVTETKIIADFGRARQVLHDLRALGVRIAIDDFGTGYSSLVQLQQLPADEIKIDRSFVMDMERNTNNAAIVRSTIGLARNLGLDVTAEGVETRGAYDELVRLGCAFAQGYLPGRPLPADACEREYLRPDAGARGTGEGPARFVRVVAVALALAVAGGAPAAERADAATGGYVVTYRDGVDAAPATAALERRAGFAAGQRYEAVVGGFAAVLTERQLARVAADPAVAGVVPDVAVVAHGMGGTGAKEVVPPGVRRVRAASATPDRAADHAVAVVDTGLPLDVRRSDLDAVHGVDCIEPGTPADDDNGHGTHVGGTIAARHGGSGVVGVAPGTRLVAVKVLDRKGAGSISSILCGLEWVARSAAALDIRVVNLSLGTTGTDTGSCDPADPLHAAVCALVEAGVTVVASAGNAGTDLARAVPASYAEVLTVTAVTDTDGVPGGGGEPCAKTQRDDEPWSDTNFAVDPLDVAHVIAAPGACVVSAKPHGGTTTMSGTSMAAPHVAGAVALCLGSGGTPGPCAGRAPAAIIRRLRADAAFADAAGWGFPGDPGRFGHLVSAAAY